MANLAGTDEGQPLVARHISLRIHDVADALGSSSDGSLQPAHYRIWHTRQHCQWRCVVLDVQAGDPRSDHSCSSTTQAHVPTKLHRSLSATSTSHMFPCAIFRG